MILKAGKENNEKIMEFLQKELEMNVFIIGSIENYGYESKELDIWLEVKDDVILAILMRYYDNLSLYAGPEFDLHGIIRLINTITYKVLSGKESVISKVDHDLEFQSKQSFIFSKLDKHTYKEFYEDKNIEIQKLESKDVDNLIQLRQSIKEFKSPVNRASTIYDLDNSNSRGYYIKVGSKMIAVAQTTAENNNSAIIVGVCADKNYRGNGYASVCTQRLCRDVLQEGKSLCLFYENPIAAKIYKNIGFIEIGMWKMNVK